MTNNRNIAAKMLSLRDLGLNSFAGDFTTAVPEGKSKAVWLGGAKDIQDSLERRQVDVIFEDVDTWSEGAETRSARASL